MDQSAMKIEKRKTVDIIKLASDKYKVDLDKGCESKTVKKADRWELIIKCTNGEIYPFSNELLGFHCVRKIIRNRLHEEHPEIVARNWSDNGEAIFLFELEQFGLIAKYAKPRKIRKLSEEHKAILAKSSREALKAYRKSNSKLQNMA
jgi:hypothetical protein